MAPVRFFKVLMPGFETTLKLPPAFNKTLNNLELNSKKAVLKSSEGSWKVDFKKGSDGLLRLFGEGWEDYVSAHDLKTREFIVFEHIGHLRFNTLMFDETRCNKTFDNSENEDDDVEILEHVQHFDARGEEVPPNKSRQTLISQFRTTITSHHLKGVLVVPTAFARANEMSKKENEDVELRNDTGFTWLAKIAVYNLKGCNRRPLDRRKRVSITGLSVFFRKNKVKVGNTCIFKLVQPSTSRENIVMDVVFERRK